MTVKKTNLCAEEERVCINIFFIFVVFPYARVDIISGFSLKSSILSLSKSLLLLVLMCATGCWHAERENSASVFSKKAWS